MTDLVQIAPRHIAAAYEFQAKADSRYMLEGMLIELDTLVTTDGKGMFVAGLDTIEDGFRSHGLTESVIVALPSRFITECRKLKHRDETSTMANLLFDFETGEHFAYITGETRFPFKILDGTYPDWRAVLKSNCIVGADRNPEEFTMQGYLLEAVGKAAKLLTPRGDHLSGVFFSPREHETTIVRFHHAPECFAVLMPMRETTYKLNDALPVSLEEK